MSTPALSTATRGSMRVLRTVAELRAAVAAARGDGKSIALVPTMGAFHEGHLALMRRARTECGFVVVSLFVNPTQFNDPSDLRAYPRDEARDERLAAAEGVDVLFVPAVDEVYPAGFATSVEVGALAAPLEGATRGPEHFRGVATVVTKLFNMARPDVAYFGQKDAQQAAVIRRLARDLDFDLRVEVCPTVREADGLAMSSRNVRLSPEARAQATALHAALRAIAHAAAGGQRTVADLMVSGQAVLDARGINRHDVDYLAIVDGETLAEIEQLEPGRPALAAIAAHVGGVRLIDNVVIDA